MVTIGEDGVLDVKELSVNNSDTSDPKYTFKRGGNAQLYQNILESNVFELVIAKESLDGSIFTPNKQYSMQNYKASDEYNGDYLLVEKKDIIRNASGVFLGMTEFRLKKIGYIGNIGDTVADSGNILSTQSETRYSAAVPKRKIIPVTKKTTTTKTTSTKSTATKSSEQKVLAVGGPGLMKSVAPALISSKEKVEIDLSSRISKRPDISDIDDSCAECNAAIPSPPSYKKN